jgi:hypothetical protein
MQSFKLAVQAAPRSFKRFILIGLALWLIGSIGPAMSGPVADGKEWFQPADITGFSWNDFNAVCGGGGACTGSVGTTDLTGWTWASVDDVNALFNRYIGSNQLSGPSSYQEVDSAWAPAFFSDFTPSDATVSIENRLLGLVRDEFNGTNGRYAQLQDSLGTSTGDSASTASGFSKLGSNSKLGAFLYRPDPDGGPPPPEAFTGTYSFNFSDFGSGSFKYDGVTGAFESLQYKFGALGSFSSASTSASIFGSPPNESVFSTNGTFYPLKNESGNLTASIRLYNNKIFRLFDTNGVEIQSGTYNIALVTPGEITEGNNVISIPVTLPVDDVGNVVVDVPEISLTFEDVDGSSTAATVQVISTPPQEPLPSGFQVSGTTAFLNIEVPATFRDSVEVCIGYDESSVNEDTLKLYHREEYDPENDPGVFLWFDITNSDSPDTTNKIICGTTTSFSIVAIVYTNNLAPTAVAGDDQAIRIGNTVNLDGSSSFDDNTASEVLDYSWSLSSPPGSAAELFDSDTVTPSFVADVAGTFDVSLVVTDEGDLSSEPDSVEISTDNLAPTANTGDDRLVIIGTAVVLDGSNSTDPEMDSLTFDWTITSAPEGSTATINDSDLVTAGLAPDLEGEYEVTLMVSDFLGAGAPDSMLIMATTAQGFAENRILIAANIVADLKKSQFTKKGNQKKFIKELNKVVKHIQKVDAKKAAKKLEKLIQRTDGCSTKGSPDNKGKGRDWITDCAEQVVVMGYLTEALDALAP